ncbi:MAG: hypothetical protein ABII94_00865 [Patescibacteria group bacterium]
MREYSNQQEIEKCKKWIAEWITPIKTINRKRSAYGLKHFTELLYGYVSNDSFIDAAIQLGYKYVATSEKESDFYFNMSFVKTKNYYEKINDMKKNGQLKV